MINLSLGLAYVHYGLKRQSTNRQYLILQGQAFISHYIDSNADLCSSHTKAERYYNVGRLFQLIGVAYLGYSYYNKALAEFRDGGDGNETDLKNMIVVNNVVSLLSVENKGLAFQLLKTHLRI